MTEQTEAPPLRDRLSEFALDWALMNGSERTMKEYRRILGHYLGNNADPTSITTKAWILALPTPAAKRMSARAIRCFGRWLEAGGDHRLNWWREIPLAKEPERPQPTVTSDEYEQARRLALTTEEKLIIELLWCAGLRRGELAAVRVADVNLEEGFIVVPRSKTDEPRLAPLSTPAIDLIKEHLQAHTGDVLLTYTYDGIRKFLKRHGLLSSHAWRRGWASQSLRSGVSQVSVQAAGGWRSSAMVIRYTKAHRNENAMVEFRRLRAG